MLKWQLMSDSLPKRSQEKSIENMFSDIAHRYDFLNHLLSFGVDIHWRNEAVKLASQAVPKDILDVATGTGDLAIALKKAIPAANISGIDFSENMLNYAKQKLAKKSLDIDFRVGDGQNIDFEDNSFDLLTIAYGIRNFSDRDLGLREFYRVLRPGGKLIILEFPPPDKDLFGRLFGFYFFKISPYIAGLFSGRRDAYEYLGQSVREFPRPEDFTAMIANAGFAKAEFKKQLFGISVLYYGEKQ